MARVHGRGLVGDCRFAPFFLGDFVGDVGAGEGAAVDTEAGADGFGKEADAGLGDVDAFDAGDAAGKGDNFAGEGGAGAGDELVGQVEDEEGGVFDGVDEGRVGYEVWRERDVWEVFDVFVFCIDDGGEFLRLGGFCIVVFRVFWYGDLFFKHPHLHIELVDVWVSFCVFSHNLGDCGTPATVVSNCRKG